MGKGLRSQYNFKTYLIMKFWYVVWFIIVPIIGSLFVCYILFKFDQFDAPWFFILSLAIISMILYNIKEKLPWWYDPKNYPTFKMLKKEAQQYIRQLNKVKRKYQGKVDKRVLDKIERNINELSTGIESKDRTKLLTAVNNTEKFIKKELKFAKKVFVWDYSESVIVAVLVALLLRAFVVEAFKIPTGSMIPTLIIGDHIFVNKFIYGLRVPFTKFFLVKFRKPRRGEVIVFIYPRDESRDFIKRVIGIEGDIIEMNGNQVIINGEPVPRCYLGRYVYYEENPITEEKERIETDLYLETLGGYYYKVIYNPERPFSLGWHGPVRVPKGQLFVMGDNRDDSQDSRIWGGVPLRNLKGRALMIWWSSSYNGIALNRIGKLIMKNPKLSPKELEAVKRCVKEEHFPFPKNYYQ